MSFNQALQFAEDRKLIIAEGQHCRCDAEQRECLLTHAAPFMWVLQRSYCRGTPRTQFDERALRHAIGRIPHH